MMYNDSINRVINNGEVNEMEKMEVKFSRQHNPDCDVLKFYYNIGGEKFADMTSFNGSLQVNFFGVDLKDLDEILAVVLDAREQLLKDNR